MALRRPGMRSNASLLSSSALAIVLLTILIGGHVILAYLVIASIFGDGGLKTIAAHTNVPAWVLVVLVVGAIIMDVWIAHSMRQARQRKKQR